MSVELIPKTRELFHELFRVFQYDPSLYADPALFESVSKKPYSREDTDARWDKRISKPDALTFAVMLDGSVIGEVVLKAIDLINKRCELGIHLINDSVKGFGYGTQAERLAIEYAFNELGMEEVLADTILKNTRSQHIIGKLGFERVYEKDGFIFYTLGKDNYYADSSDR